MSEEIKKNDPIGRRITRALVESGVSIFNFGPVTVEDAWKLVASSQAGWDHYIDDRQSLPGGLTERPIKNPFSHQTVAWTFIGLKNLDRPDGWRKGLIGFSGAILPLGYFPNKI